MKRKLFLALLVLLVVIQFIQPEANDGPPYNSSFYLLPMQAEVEQLLKQSCYDCHSNHTNYPWYAWIQPVAWWLDDHIREGKQSLNFDEFHTYDSAFKQHKLEEIAAEVKSGKMPLPSYTSMHPEARLSAAQKSAIINWTKAVSEKMREKQ